MDVRKCCEADYKEGGQKLVPEYLASDLVDNVRLEMPMDKDVVFCEWSQPGDLDDPEENQMQGECSRGTLQRESSISFGRFESDNLAWEKWSSFSQNRYMEEVEKFSTPGSVIQKKAYFEAHFKKIAAQKALEQAALLEQQTQLESQSGIGISNLNENHHLEESIELLDSNGKENKEHTSIQPIDFDNSPHQSDTEEGNLNTIHPNNDMFVSQTMEPREHLHPLINNIDQEEVSGEDIASCNNIMLENEKEHLMLDKHMEAETSSMMEVDKMITSEEPEHQRSPKTAEAENKGIEEFEMNEVVSNHSQTENQKEKPVPKDTATSNGKKAQIPRNRASTSRSLSNGTTRTSKVSYRPNNAARSLPNVSGKPENGVATRKKVADGDTTTRKTPVIAEKGASTRQALGDKKQAAEAVPNDSTKVITSNKETSSNRAPKTPSLRTSNTGHNRNHNLTTTKKQTEKKLAGPKNGGDADKSTTARSHKSPAAKRLVNKASGTVFSFKSDERAEKRKEFYMKLEEKMNAKEAEMHEIQAKTQEELEAEIKQLRRSLNFKATPMPTFYQETTKIEVESKKIRPISAKSQKLGRKSTNSASDSDSSCVPTHDIIVSTEQGVNNNTSPSKKNEEAQLDISITSKGHKEVGSNNFSNGKPSKSRLPSITSPRKEARDGLKANVTENPSVNEERNKAGVHVSTDNTSAMTSSSELNGRQENLVNDVQAKSEIKNDESESKMITKSEIKVEGQQNTNNFKEKISTQKGQGVKDKDSTMNSGSVSRIRPNSSRHASPSMTHEPKDRVSKTVKHERQKIVMPVDKAKRESTSNASVKRGIKGNAGLACLIPDVAVA